LAGAGSKNIGKNMNSQTAIPCYFMRGGTSKGAFFLAEDLPADTATRDRVLLAAMGSPDPRQIDGLGGAHPLTTKVGIVSKSQSPGVDLVFLFAQLQPNSALVDTTPNCGNMLAAVLPFAIERGLIEASHTTTTARVLTLNTDMQADITVQTPGGVVSYSGEARIDGAPGSSAPVQIAFLDTAGSVCASLLPTGKVIDHFNISGDTFATQSIATTCIDNGMPLVILRATDLGVTGHESVAECNANHLLKAKLEALRLVAAEHMGLGDVRQKNFPKMTLIAPAQQGGAISTRSFIPHVCHDAIGVLAAVTVATACVLPNTVCAGLAQVSSGNTKDCSIEHPTGEFTVSLTTENNTVTSAALLRTARLIMRGEVMIPRSIWKGHDVA
jgi:4-oxalomesaconate tautomerase